MGWVSREGNGPKLARFSPKKGLPRWEPCALHSAPFCCSWGCEGSFMRGKVNSDLTFNAVYLSNSQSLGQRD